MTNARVDVRTNVVRSPRAALARRHGWETRDAGKRCVEKQTENDAGEEVDDEGATGRGIGAEFAGGAWNAATSDGE